LSILFEFTHLFFKKKIGQTETSMAKKPKREIKTIAEKKQS